jgi:hypothetical protein
VKKALGLALSLAFAADGAVAGATAIRGRLQGTFAMHGRVTRAVNVYGERRGQRVRRAWTFIPQCPTGSCRRVTLKRERSGQNILDTVVLKRKKPGVYVGHGHFWVALRCAGHVVAHGGRARETITVRITSTTQVGASHYATAIHAGYENPRRVNLTRCPGGIGHDAARYYGRLTTALPTAP